jgi:hypothetical protein
VFAEWVAAKYALRDQIAAVKKLICESQRKRGKQGREQCRLVDAGCPRARKPRDPKCVHQRVHEPILALKQMFEKFG